MILRVALLALLGGSMAFIATETRRAADAFTATAERLAR